MRVLLIKYLLSTDGPVTLMYNIGQELKDQVRFDWLLSKDCHNSWRQQFEDVGSQIKVIPSASGSGVVGHLKEYRNYYRFFKTNRYDVIHVHSESPQRAFIILMAWLAKVPVKIYHSHSAMKMDEMTSWIRKCRIMIDRLVLRTLANERIACSDIAGFWMFGRKAQFHLLQNGIHVEQFRFDPQKREAKRKLLGIEDDDIVLVHVGRIEEQKNHRFLIDVFNDLHKIDQKYKLMIIGEGSLYDEIYEKVKQYDLLQSVIFTGNITDVPDYLFASDLFVLPSLFEGLPIVGIEAECSGLRCLYADTISRQVDLTGENAFLPLTKEAWVSELRNEEVLDLSQRSVFADVVKEKGYDIKTTANELKQIYENGVSNNKNVVT